MLTLLFTRIYDKLRHTMRAVRSGTRDARIQKTIDDPLFLPPIDIVIPSPDILPTFHSPKFFSIETCSEIFFWYPEIFLSGNVLEVFPPENYGRNFISAEFGGRFYGVNIVPEIFISQNSLEIPAESRGG